MTTAGREPGAGAPASTTDDVAVTFVTEGEVPDAAVRRAEEMIGDLARRAPRPVIFARVKLRNVSARPPDERVIVQGTVDVSGYLLRVSVTGSEMIEAINHLGRRLDRKLRSLRERFEDRTVRSPQAPAGQWRSGDLPTRRPDFYPRPVEEREVVRRKTWADDRISLAEAVFDLYALDHRFFLFTDELDGVDSVVFETDDGAVRLRRVTGDRPPRDGRKDLDIVEPIEAPVPRMTEDEAVERLNSTNEAFVFFVDDRSGRGSVLYRRYDGHYGLIEPAD